MIKTAGIDAIEKPQRQYGAPRELSDRSQAVEKLEPPAGLEPATCRSCVVGGVQKAP
jgi:hypothetical protein